MAALDVHCGMERGAHVWPGECVDLLDSFDSEMQEWEDQLQDVQRKIEELYNEVKARRGAAEHSAVSSPNHAHPHFSLLPADVAGGYRGCRGTSDEVIRSGHPCRESRGALAYHGDSVNGMCHSDIGYHDDGLARPGSFQGNGSCDVTLDILNGYLGQGEYGEHRRCRAGTLHAGSGWMNGAVNCGQDSCQQGPVSGRIGNGFEEVENRKNTGVCVDGARHVSWREPISSLRQRDVPFPIGTHSTHFPESLQQPDKKCSLMDRKCGSPSVLRKFGAMLQENEGKTLIENGTVTTVISADTSSKVPATPVCQRKFGASWASTHMPAQKSPQDPDMSVPGVEEPAGPRGSRGGTTALPFPRGALQSGVHRGVTHPPTTTTNAHRPEAGGSRKPPTGPTPRAGAQAGLWGAQGVELLQPECRVLDRTLGVCAGSQYQGGNCSPGQDRRGLWESRRWEEQGSAAHSVQQSSCESPNPRRSFSRPSRPANQRPPSRWANHAPTAKIATPSGPMLRPHIPAHKAKQSFNNFNLYAETVIM